jgi:hypothetical protein
MGWQPTYEQMSEERARIRGGLARTNIPWDDGIYSTDLALEEVLPDGQRKVVKILWPDDPDYRIYSKFRDLVPVRSDL